MVDCWAVDSFVDSSPTLLVVVVSVGVITASVLSSDEINGAQNELLARLAIDDTDELVDPESVPPDPELLGAVPVVIISNVPQLPVPKSFV